MMQKGGHQYPPNSVTVLKENNIMMTGQNLSGIAQTNMMGRRLADQNLQASQVGPPAQNFSNMN